MNGNDGNQEVKGYEPPGGSMAEQQRQMRDDEARRQQQADADRQAQAMQQQADADRAAQQSGQRRAHQQRANPKRPQNNTKAGRRTKKQPARISNAAQANARATGKPQTQTAELGTQLGILAFLIVGGVVAWRIEVAGAGRWIGAAIAGGVAAYVVAKFYKALFVIAALAGAAWGYSAYNAPAEVDPFDPAPSAGVASSTQPATASALPPNPAYAATTAPVSTPPTSPKTAPSGAVAERTTRGTCLGDPPTIVHIESWQGKPIDMLIAHDGPIAFEDIQHFESHGAGQQPVVQMTDGRRIAFGIKLDPETELAFETLKQFVLISGPTHHPETGKELTWGSRPARRYPIMKEPTFTHTTSAP